MVRRQLFAALCLLSGVLAAGAICPSEAEAAGRGQPSDWQRFYYYPYVYYPQNFQRQPESFDHLYYRYPVERQIPVYRKDWHNFYPSPRPWHSGHHFILDVF
jgi:hypothetical protein